MRLLPAHVRHRLPAAGPGLAVVAALAAALGLTAGCQNRQRQAERQQQEQALAAAAAERRQLDALVQRCQAGREELVRAADALAATETALAKLEQRRYRATPRPPAPDPAVLQRFTISDQELEMERHQQAVQSWQQQEQERRARWQAEQRQQRRQLLGRLEQQRQALSEANPAVLAPETGAELNGAVLAAYRDCDRDSLAQLNRR